MKRPTTKPLSHKSMIIGEYNVPIDKQTIKHMKSIENIVSELNMLIQTEKVDERQLTELLNSLSNLVNYQIQLIDLAFYNEERLEKAKSEKFIGVEKQNYEWAAYHRDLEEECIKHIELKNQFNIKSTFFHFEPNSLLFFYMGTSPFEAKFKEFILKHAPLDK